MYIQNRSFDSISIVIPAYNEAQRIGNTLEKIESFVQAYPCYAEVIIVNDGSTDDTMGILRQWSSPAFRLLCMDLEGNKGKGRAIREGMLKARNDFILFTDADLSTPIDELFKLMSAIESGAEIAIGSRKACFSEILKHQPLYRRVLSWFFHKIVVFFGLACFSDTQCGFKLFTRKAAHYIFRIAKVNGFVFDLESLIIAKKRNLPIQEVGVRWYDDPRSTVSLRKHWMSIVGDLIRIQCYLLIGGYNNEIQRDALSSSHD